MNRNDEIEIKEKTPEEQADSGEYVVLRNYHHSMIALAVCFVLAVMLWMVSMNAEDTRRYRLHLDATGADNYTYTLSLDEVEVKGRISALKDMSVVHVNIPMLALVTEGTYVVPAEYVELPDGVRLTEDVELTITVTPK